MSPPGWGLHVQESFWYFNAILGFYEGAEPRWMAGSGFGSTDVTLNMQYLIGNGLCPSCGAKGMGIAQSAWSGSTTRTQIADGSATSGWLTTNLVRNGSPVWQRSAPIQLLTAP